MALMLDSDHLIALLRGVQQAHLQYRSVPADEFLAVSVITAAELYYGVAKSQDSDGGRRAVREWLDGMVIFLVTDEIAERFGDIKAYLQQRGAIIPDFDILIGATTLVHDCTLVTHNTRHFARIPGLHLVDWLA